MTRSETTSSAGQPSFNARIFVSGGVSTKAKGWV